MNVLLSSSVMCSIPKSFKIKIIVYSLLDFGS